MNKKISAIILSLILCLSSLVVPVSAALSAEGTENTVQFELKWDKEYYSPGDTANLEIYMIASPTTQLGTGTIMIGLNSSQINETDNSVDTIKETMIPSDLWASFWRTNANLTVAWFLETSTIGGKVDAANTAGEGDLYDHYLKLTINRDTTGTHANATTTKYGMPGQDLIDLYESGKPVMTLPLKVSESAEMGTTLYAGVTTGTLLCNPAQTGFKYIKNPGVATTANSTIIASANASSTIGKEPCAPDAHVWDAGAVTTAPTCGAAGVRTLTCTVCNSTKDVEEPATGLHTAGETVKENVVAPSCKDAGSHDDVVYCAVCSAELSRNPVVDSATGEHVYATEVARVDATCTDAGSVTMACGCGEKQETEIPATGHAYGAVVTDPTCTEAGYTTYTCANCNDVYTDNEVAAAGHSYDDGVVTTDPTCTVAGVKTFTCPTCGNTYTEEVAATGHTEVEIPAVAPTCTAVGATAGTKCSVCNEVLVAPTEIAAAGHNYVQYLKADGSRYKEPTCTRTGSDKYTCSVCNDSYTEVLPALNHPAEYREVIPAVEATCKAEGSTAGEKCTLCGNTVTAGQKIEKLPHTYGEPVVVAPTFTAEGYTKYTCTVCGDVYKDNFVDIIPTIEIPALDVTEVSYKEETIIPSPVADLANSGMTVTWTADNDNFTMTQLEDGSLKVQSAKDGETTFTVTLVDANGNEVASDSVKLTSKAGILEILKYWGHHAIAMIVKLVKDLIGMITK